MYEGHDSWQDVKALTGEGEPSVDKLRTERLLELDVPGLDTVAFDSLSQDVYFPVPSQRVEVPSGEIVELVRRQGGRCAGSG